MKYLIKPRGRGYSLRMVTPEALIGTKNPWTNKPFGKEIKLGLNTQRHAEAVRLRDVRVGQIRQLEADALAEAGRRSVGRIIDLSPESAAEWRQMREEAADTYDLDSILIEKLERAERAGRKDEARAFANRVFRGAIPIEEALGTYLEERREGNPHGYDPLATTTASNVRSSVKHLIAFFGAEKPTLHDVTPDKAFKFRTEYLPLIVGVKPQTVAKHMTLLGGMWSWAIHNKRFLKTKSGRPISNPWDVEEKGAPTRRTKQQAHTSKKEHYTPEQVTTLLQGFPEWGDRRGDIMRLALATGCRVDEIGSLKLMYAEEDGSGFTVPKGKSESARRHVPLVGDAQRLMAQRISKVKEMQRAVAEGEQRLFPEWPLKPATQKANSISQWFSRYRRQKLGRETDGKLNMHSFRHTWATLARRAGVPDDRRKELGGWAGKREASDAYDHGLIKTQLGEEQAKVWDAYMEAGYLKAF